MKIQASGVFNSAIVGLNIDNNNNNNNNKKENCYGLFQRDDGIHSIPI